MLPDLTSMSMDALTSHPNSLVAKAIAAGGDRTVYRPAARLPNLAVGVRLCQDLERAIDSKEIIKVRAPRGNPNNPATSPPGTANGSAPKAAAAPRVPKERDPNAPPTIHQLTEKFNSMVPEAQRLGVTWAKEHTSDFASRDGAQKQIDRLAADVDKAKQPKPTDGAGNTVGMPA